MKKRPYGTGSIQKKGNKYYFRYRLDGEYHTEPMSNVSSDEEADALADRLWSAMQAKNIEQVTLLVAESRKIIKAAESLPLSNVWAAFEKNSGRPACGVRTLTGHRRAWNLFQSYIAHSKPQAATMSDITHADADAWADSLDKDKPRAYNTSVGSLKLIFKTLRRRSGLAENPFGDIAKLYEATENKKDFDDNQLFAVFDAIDADYPLSVPHRREMAVAFRIAAYTGQRLKDCCLLKWEYVDMERNWIKAKPCKTQRYDSRINVPIHADLRKMLEALPRHGEFVLPGVADRYRRNPSGVDQSACRAIWWALTTDEERAAKREKKSRHSSSIADVPDSVPGYGFHSFRHAFVSFCANAGVPLAVVQEIVGQNNIAVTWRYTHIKPETLQKAVKAIPGRDQARGKEPRSILAEKLAQMTADNWQTIRDELAALAGKINLP